MNREESIIVIRSYDALMKLNNLMNEITGSGLYGTQFEDLFRIGDLLYRQCSFFDAESDEAFRRFIKIIESKELTPEEKYDRLMEKW
ncbi:MAG: hypothetical protein IKH28_08680 [Lachnospiraceae bacterium]|nr:hypothetical protein [Lachnospiraceae bacterium]